MSKNSKLTPKLRFPEFRAAPAWDEATLGSQAAFHKGRGVSKAEVDPNGKRECIRYGELYTRYGEVITDVFSRTNAPDTDLFLSCVNDVIIPASGETKEDIAKASCVMKAGVVLGSDLNVIRTEHNGIFLSYFLNSARRRAIAKVAQGDTVVHLYPSQLEQITIATPDEDEQQKIADCLSSLDDLIAVEGRKLESLRAFKKGLMQQLFPRNGETTPRLRLPEFRGKGEWKEKKLGEIGHVIRGSSPRPQGDSRYFNGPVPRLMVQDVTRDGKWVTPRIDSLTEEGAKLSRPCPAGTLTIVCSGVVGVVSFLAVDACIHDGFLAIIDIEESISSKDFLYHSLSTLQEQFEKGATHGGVFTNLTTAGIKEFKINCPTHAEQQRIAKCLSPLDDLIAAQSRKVADLRTHKMGLMQQLFPSAGGGSAPVGD